MLLGFDIDLDFCLGLTETNEKKGGVKKGGLKKKLLAKSDSLSKQSTDAVDSGEATTPKSNLASVPIQSALKNGPKIVNDKLIALNSTREKFSNLKGAGVKFALDEDNKVETPQNSTKKRVQFIGPEPEESKPKKDTIQVEEVKEIAPLPTLK